MKSLLRRCTHLLLAIVGVVCSFPALAAYEYTTVDYPGAVSTQLWGINNSGQVVGTAQPVVPGPTISFLYDSRTGTFTNLPAPPLADNSGLIGINESGVKVGSSYDDDEPPIGGIDSGLILLKKGTFVSFSHPDWLNTTARAVGTSGLVTGFAYNALGAGAVGFIYDPANDSYVDILPSTEITIAQGINARGAVVGSTILGLGGAYPPGTYAFLRDKSGAITLFRVNGVSTRARGITDSGRIAGFVNSPVGISGFVASLSGAPGFEALVIDPAELLNADPSAVVTYAQGINNSGVVVGAWGDGNPDGFQHGYIATPLPPKKK